MVLKSINPATGALLKQYEEYDDKKIAGIIDSTHKDFISWRKTSFEQRAALMRKAAQILKNDKEKYARLMADEMGKMLKDGVSEAEKCALACEFYADNAAGFLKDEMVSTEASRSFVSFQPLGIVLAVMPWNFPFWQVFRFAAPALMAGNAGLLKHASNVSGCALAIEQVFQQAGFPENIFRTLLVKSDRMDGIIEHEKIMAVTLTGSVAAGKAVASKAGSCIKKTVLELGGSDAYIVLADADLELAASTCAASRLINAGQSCIAAKRFIVEEKIHDAFLEKFLEKMQAVKMGSPYEKVDMGPQASVTLRDQLHEQVEASLSKGAKLLLGGKIPEGDGAFYPATVLAGVKPGMPAYEEELFGPVAAVIKARDEQEAIAIANDSIFGLGAAIFTKDVKKGERLAREQVQAGSCFVNALVKSDPRLPFGGIKESGYGRELSAFGIREFVNIKTVLVK